MTETTTPQATNIDRPPTYQDVINASHLLKNVAHKTPVLTSRTLDNELGIRVFFKCENFQRMGAFKFRGAYTAVSHYLEQEKYGTDGNDDTCDRENAGTKLKGILTYSSGNHAQAVALASTTLLKIPSTIIMPFDAPPLKIQATKGYGGNVVFYDRYKEKRDDVKDRVLKDLDGGGDGWVFIPPYDHKYVIAGQGTVGKELIEDLQNWDEQQQNGSNESMQRNPTQKSQSSSSTSPENSPGITLDYLFVCVGGGGLISGCALSAHALSPKTKIIGVEPAAGNDAQQSLQTNSIVSIPTPITIADGAQTQNVGNLTFEIMKRHVDRIVTVSDEELVEGMKFFGERMKMVVEPTGCLGLAGARKMVGSGEIEKGSCCGVVISGGNVDLGRYCELISSSLRVAS